MKIHTTRKYLASLSIEPERAMALRFKEAYAAACKSFSVQPLRAITVAVTGRDAVYAANVMSDALCAASVSVGIIRLDRRVSPDEAVKIDGEKIPADEASFIYTFLRKQFAKLAQADASGSLPTVYEVMLIGSLVACARAGVQNVIVTVDADVFPAEFAALIPVPRILLVTAASTPEGTINEMLVRRGTAEVVSAPQSGETLRALTVLSSAVNCRYTVVAKGEINAGEPNFHGTPFTYRSVSATTSTYLISMLGAASAAAEGVHALCRMGVAVTDEQIGAAITAVRPEGRGNAISFNPFVLSCVCYPDDLHKSAVIVADIEQLVLTQKKRLDIIASSDIASCVDFSAILDTLADDGCLPGTVAAVGKSDKGPGKRSDAFLAVGGIYIICQDLADCIGRIPEYDEGKSSDRMLLIVGSADFVAEAETRLRQRLAVGLSII